MLCDGDSHIIGNIGMFISLIDRSDLVCFLCIRNGSFNKRVLEYDIYQIDNSESIVIEMTCGDFFRSIG